MKLTNFYNTHVANYENTNIQHSMTSIDFRNKLVEDLNRIKKENRYVHEDLRWIQFVIPKKLIADVDFYIENEIDIYNLEILAKLIDCGYELPISYKYAETCCLVITNAYFDFTTFNDSKYKQIQHIIKFRMVISDYENIEDEKQEVKDIVTQILFNEKTQNYMLDWALLNTPEIVSKDILKLMFKQRKMLSKRVKKRIVKMSKHFNFQLSVIYSVIINSKLKLPKNVESNELYLTSTKFDNKLRKLFDEDVVKQYYKNVSNN